MTCPGDECSGEWIKGSGGHRLHAPCDKLATWTHPEDPYAYCDEHIVEHDKPMYNYEKPAVKA